jgi:hypothetical protein
MVLLLSLHNPRVAAVDRARRREKLRSGFRDFQDRDGGIFLAAPHSGK